MLSTHCQLLMWVGRHQFKNTVTVLFIVFSRMRYAPPPPSRGFSFGNKVLPLVRNC